MKTYHFILMLIPFYGIAIAANYKSPSKPKLQEVHNEKQIIKELNKELATPLTKETKSLNTIPNHVLQYIYTYKKTAIEESKLFNIPTSIILAQGILESNSGKSSLSKKYNNHFGVKYRKKGKYVIYADDTPKDKFQVYKSAWYSYRDHSKLLISSRYKHLTKLKKTDYKSWARGLQKAGYATNKNYAKILIQIIEQYNLTKYDK